MGCGNSKEEEQPAGPANNGMGAVAHGFMRVQKGSRVSVMTGNWEISRDRVDEDNKHSLGETEFGLVYETRACLESLTKGKDPTSDMYKQVVVKKLKSDAEKKVQSLFLIEIQMMKELRHQHIVSLVGVVTMETPLLMLFEHPANGDLKAFLKSARNSGSVSNRQRVQFACHVASALSYLEDQDVVHSDVACRNVHVFEDLTAKLGDFGLSRTEYASDYTIVGAVSLPLRWMAPETIEKQDVWNTKTDVWSFGVLAWEISSFGNQPYPNLSNGEVGRHILSGNILEESTHTPPGLYDVIKKALSFEPSERGTFKDALNELEALVPRQKDEGLRPESALSKGEGPGRTSVSLFSESQSKLETTTESRTVSERSIQLPNNGSLGDVLADDGSKTGVYTDPQDARPSMYDVATYGSDKISPDRRESKASRKSFRSLSAFKEADNPAAALGDLIATGKSNVPEIERAEIAVEKEIGKGAFGVVALGTMDSIGKVALKTLKPGASEDDKDALIAEGFLVAQFNHPNVVACLGQVTIGEPIMIVFEFMSNGSLYGYLKDLPEEPDLRTKMRMVIDIATGMSYLSGINHVHRDLATRNVLVGSDLVCKIADFGLSRDLEDEMYYESDGGMIPIRWTPPEAYKYKKFSTKSDIWSFGILMYEVWTKANLPYGAKWSNLNVMMEVERGYRMPPPPSCPRAIYSCMMDCWNPARRSRPTFDNLKDRLQMAYDMLFTADTGEAVLEVEDKCADLQELYRGIPVPTLENLDSEFETYLAPQPLDKPDMGSRKSSRSSLHPTMELEEGMKKRRESQSITPTQMPNLRPTGVTSPVNPISERRPSLRKQKQASNQNLLDENVEYVSVKRVQEVLSLSRQREKIAAVQETGVLNATKSGMIQDSDKLLVNPIYIESVGRARETVESTGAIVGRKTCVCRRFKCVCGNR